MAATVAIPITSSRPHLSSRPHVTDARPIVPRTPSNPWTRAEEVRDELYDELMAAGFREGIDALVLKSGPFVYPPWVKFTCWIPERDRTLTERVGILITVEPTPYHAFEFEFRVQWTYRHKESDARVVPFGRADVGGIVRYLLNRGRKPECLSRRFREHGLQWVRPKNRITGLRIDAALLLIVFLSLTGVTSLSVAGGVTMEQALMLLSIPASWLVWRAGRQRTYVRTHGKPEGEPRFLVRVDSWQAVVFGLGRERDQVWDRFLKTLDAAPLERFHHHVEHVWYWGLDGKEEREQIVLTSGRGIVFCQIYRYGDDLYVGWNGELNTGQWVEEEVARGIDRPSSKPVVLKKVVPGSQQVTDYDWMDLSALVEWAHAQVVKLLKQLIEEHHIDQEIDFKIVRGERQHPSKEPDKAKQSRKLFQRTA